MRVLGLRVAILGFLFQGITHIRVVVLLFVKGMQIHLFRPVALRLLSVSISTLLNSSSSKSHNRLRYAVPRRDVSFFRQVLVLF